MTLRRFKSYLHTIEINGEERAASERKSKVMQTRATVTVKRGVEALRAVVHLHDQIALRLPDSEHVPVIEAVRFSQDSNAVVP